MLRFDLKASFASRPMLRLISWYSKPGDITKEYWEKAIQFRGNFHWLKITNWTTNVEALDSPYLRAFFPIFRKTFSFFSLYDELQVRQVSLLTVNHKHFKKMHWICSTLALFVVNFKYTHHILPFLGKFKMITAYLTTCLDKVEALFKTVHNRSLK